MVNHAYTENQISPKYWWTERHGKNLKVHSVDNIPPRFYVPDGMGKARSNFTDFRGRPLDMYTTRFPRDTYDARRRFTGAGHLTYEADRLYPEVCAEKIGFKPDDFLGEPRRTAFLDIEIEETINVMMKDIIFKPYAPILMMTVIDSMEGDKTVFRIGDDGNGEDSIGDTVFYDSAFESEQEMLNRFFNFCRYRGFDQYATWYGSGGMDKLGPGKWRKTSGFDIPYILARSNEIRVNPSRWSPCNVVKLSYDPKDQYHRSQIKLASLIDMMYFAKSSRKLKDKKRGPPDFKLDTIGRMFLGKGKVNKPTSFSKQYATDRRKAMLYNIRDVEILEELEEKYKFIEDQREMQRFGIINLEDTIYATKVIDRFCIRKAHQQNVALPTKIYEFSGDGDKISQKKKTGGAVLNISAGISHNVATIDFKGLYPAIVRALNIGMETKDSNGDIRAANGVRFASKPRSLIAQLYDDLEGLKKSNKKKMNQFTAGTRNHYNYYNRYMRAKEVVNSTAGGLGSRSFRFFDEENFNAITVSGAHFIGKMEKIARSHKYSVLAGDTDSILFCAPFDKVQEVVDEVNGEINDTIKSWGGVSKVEVDFERYSKKVITINRKDSYIGAKKKRAEWVTWEDDQDVDYIRVTGFEVVKSDTSPWMADKQEKFLEISLKEGKEESEKKISEWLKELKDTPLEELCDWCPVRNMNIDESDIKIQKGDRENVKAVKNSIALGLRIEPMETPHKVKSVDGHMYAFTDESQLDEWNIEADMDYYVKRFKGRINEVLIVTGGVWPSGRIKTLASWGSSKAPVYSDGERVMSENRKQKRGGDKKCQSSRRLGRL